MVSEEAQERGAIRQPDEYVVRRAEDGRSVEAWSTRPLPYAPVRDAERALRSDLKTALSTLSGHANDALHATHGMSAASRENLDSENVLFYNVGAASFARLDTREVLIERAHSFPSPPAEMHMPARSYHRYACAAPDQGLNLWAVRQPLARWTDVEVPKLSSGSKVAAIWLRMAESTLDLCQAPEALLSRFGLTVTIAAPEVVHITAVIKPLLDGIIASFQAHLGEAGEVSRRIAADVGRTETAITTLLQRRQRTFLGSRALVVTRAGGVQWQPDDHLLAAAVVQAHMHDNPRWLISGSFVALRENTTYADA